jgi:hypothetical protein
MIPVSLTRIGPFDDKIPSLIRISISSPHQAIVDHEIPRLNNGLNPVLLILYPSLHFNLILFPLF